MKFKSYSKKSDGVRFSGKSDGSIGKSKKKKNKKIKIWPKNQVF